MGLPLAALLQEEKLTDDQVFPGLAGVRLHNKSRGREGEGEGGWKGGVRTMINKSAGVHTKLLHNNHSPAHPTQPTRSAFLFFGGGGYFLSYRLNRANPLAFLLFLQHLLRDVK